MNPLDILNCLSTCFSPSARLPMKSQIYCFQVENILVIGHSSCGGIQALMSMQDDADSRFDYATFDSVFSVLMASSID